MNGTSTKFTLKDVPVENQRPLKVVIIGAGFSGIYSTIRCVVLPCLGAMVAEAAGTGLLRG
jgi:hypothetical protein